MPITASSAATRSRLVFRDDLVCLVGSCSKLISFPFAVEDFCVVAREERAEVSFVAFCTLFLFIFESCLFALFDGDTDDLHCGSISVAWVARWNGHENIESFHDLAEDAVLVI